MSFDAFSSLRELWLLDFKPHAAHPLSRLARPFSELRTLKITLLPVHPVHYIELALFPQVDSLCMYTKSRGPSAAIFTGSAQSIRSLSLNGDFAPTSLPFILAQISPRLDEIVINGVGTRRRLCEASWQHSGVTRVDRLTLRNVHPSSLILCRLAVSELIIQCELRIGCSRSWTQFLRACLANRALETVLFEKASEIEIMNRLTYYPIIWKLQASIPTGVCMHATKTA